MTITEWEKFGGPHVWHVYVPPTPEQEAAAREKRLAAAAEREARLAEKVARLQPGYREALAKLDALTGLEREILDLHSFPPHRYPYCNGSREDEWPCETVLLIAERNGIDLDPNFHNYYDPDWKPGKD